MSPTATEGAKFDGSVPKHKVSVVVKVPNPSFRYTLLCRYLLAATMSSLPSSFMSPTATEEVSSDANEMGLDGKHPAPLFRFTTTEEPLAATMSSLSSLFRWAIASDRAPDPIPDSHFDGA